jgi:uncharacterized membrane protein
MQLLSSVRLRDQLQGFWVVPGAVALGYAVLAVVLLRLDRASSNVGRGFGFGGDAAAARSVLGSVASGVISMTSLTLSLTIVTLQLASSQFTPRALKNLLADRINQVVAGAFLGTVAYALLVLRAVREDDQEDPGFVPALSVTVCIGLALLALALLLVFVHHVGQIIKVEHIAASIGRSSLRAADRLYPEPYGEPADDTGPPRAPGPPGEVMPSRPGYVEVIALDRLTTALQGRAERIEVLLAPGDFATPGQPAVLVWPSSALDEGRRRAVQRAVTVSSERDLRNDIGFGIRQLADIALRAVSPGVNDPTTAVTCIGYITAVLERLAARDLPGPERIAADSGVQLHARVVTFEAHLETGFLEIARSADDPRVEEALIEGLRRVAAAARAGGALDRARAALALAQQIADVAVDSATASRDEERLQHDLHRLSAGADPEPLPRRLR